MFVDPTQFGLNEDLSTYTPDFCRRTVPRRRCCVPLCAGCTGSLSKSFPAY
ncbi:hypothetical protein [Bradyrhizobium sp. CB1650]|uniref:hypothetical protein n=1 Tax=Bradyrhizobium sp. CB1650 TaxID=3039153 RepID=UPI00325FA79D